MLQTVIIILLVIWVLGVVSANTMGGLIHILLLLAGMVLIMRILQGRRL
ncbi:MAG: lmo0937 family membrane protein [Pseudomonadota bacterium]